MQCMEVWGGNEAASNAVSMPGLDVWVHSSPLEGSKSGGDVHYVSSCATGRVTRIVVADISGHGETVSHIAIQLRGLMRRHVNFVSQSSFVHALNREFVKRSGSNIFATAIVATYWAPKHELVICNAGHPRAARFCARRNEWEVLVPSNSIEGLVDLPLGVASSTDYGHLRLGLEDEDLVLFHTDSLTEVVNQEGRRLGEAGLVGILNTMCVASGPLDPAVVIGRVLDEIRVFNGGRALDDDITMLLLSRNDAAPRPIGPHLFGEWAGHWRRLLKDRVSLPHASSG